MNPTERACQPSRVQIEYLLDFLQRHPSLAKGFSKFPSARDVTRKLWEKLAVELNNLRGCIKSWKQWTKYWADKKSAVRKKSALRSRTSKIVDGAEKVVVVLSDIEEKILTLMGGDSFVACDRHSEINPLETQGTTDLSSSHSLLSSMPPELKVSPSTVTLQAMGNSNPGTSLKLETVIKIEPPSPPVPPSPPHTPTTNCSVTIPTTQSGTDFLPPHHILCDLLGSTTQDPSINTRTAHNLRQRRRRVVSSLSQPQSQLLRLTDQFLRLEEQRMEMNNLNSRLFQAFVDQQVQRDASISQALLAIAEGMKSVGEGLSSLGEGMKAFGEAMKK